MKLTWEAGPDHVRLGPGYVLDLVTPCHTVSHSVLHGFAPIASIPDHASQPAFQQPSHLVACSRIELSITPQACGAELDMVFMLDGSRSVAGSLQADAGFRNLWDKQVRTCLGTMGISVFLVVCWCCVLVLCIGVVHWYCMLVLCIGTVYLCGVCPCHLSSPSPSP